ncbi:8936_t:CDS:10 [Acaulospora morrowiae]|uniref:8936_t:CDS:1 n=1 Tax=Acaulospora morrowiae TaxID=94023 RepID=A0A9N8VRI2_9GLOM|nr:8936_t:CDS:10 [Acaulospora morrowiae]
MASYDSLKDDLRSYLHSLQKEFQDSDHTSERVIKVLRESLDFFEKGTSWNGPPPTPQLQSFFLKKLYGKHLSFIIENVLYEGFDARMRTQQDKLIVEYFIPTGEKNSQKLKRASISLRVLVTHFTLSEVDQRQQRAHQLVSIRKLIILLLRAYSFEEFYDAILNDAEIEQNEKRAEWVEFVNLICSVPERSANLMALKENHRNIGLQEETTDLDDLYPGLEGCYPKCVGLVIQVRRGGVHEFLRFPNNTLYPLLSKRLSLPYGSIYQDIWHRLIATFLPYTLETFLSSLFLHVQNHELSKIINPASIENESRYRIRRVAKVIGSLIGKSNSEAASYLIKYKYFVGGKTFSVTILRVLCCFLSWGYLHRQPRDENGEALRLGVDDDLTGLLKTLISSWSDPTFVKHGSITNQMYLTSAILIIFGYLPKETLIKAAIPREITLGVTHWLQSSSGEMRKLGMVTAEVLSGLIDEPDNILNFGVISEDEINHLKQLIEVKDGVVDPGIIEEEFSEDVIESHEIKEFQEGTEDERSNKINDEDIEPLGKEDNNTTVNEQKVDSDDEDDFEPYPMEVESENEEDEDDPAPQVRKKKVLAPVYIIDLISYLKSVEDYEKLEIAINNAGKLIRNKTGFGMELDDNAEELARIIISLQDKFELKGFEENRQDALVALSCGSPKIVVPYIIQQLFENRYSLSDKLMILSVISSSAKELAGIQTQEDVSNSKKYYIANDITEEFKDLSISTLKLPTTNIKENRFSRRPQLEALRHNSIRTNKFNEVAAKTFFFPLTAGFWALIHDRERNNLIYEPTLLQRYIVTLAVVVQCSVNTVNLQQIIREFWDLLLSLRHHDDPAVLSALLFGVSVIINSLPGRDLAEAFGKELVETQQWINAIFENRVNNEVRSMAAWISVEIKGVISEYQRLLIGDLLPLT